MYLSNYPELDPEPEYFQPELKLKMMPSALGCILFFFFRITWGTD